MSWFNSVGIEKKSQTPSVTPASTQIPEHISGQRQAEFGFVISEI
jgi:hypothetical protein